MLTMNARGHLTLASPSPSAPIAPQGRKTPHNDHHSTTRKRCILQGSWWQQGVRGKTGRRPGRRTHDFFRLPMGASGRRRARERMGPERDRRRRIWRCPETFLILQPPQLVRCLRMDLQVVEEALDSWNKARALRKVSIITTSTKSSTHRALVLLFE